MRRWGTAKRISQGTCALCQGEFSRASMAKHLEACQRRATGAARAAGHKPGRMMQHFHLVVEGRDLPMYWMHLDMMARLTRRNALKLATRLGVGLAGGVFVVERSGFMIAGNLPVSDDEVPSEPSLIGVLLYGIILAMKTNSLPPLAQQRAEAQQAGKKVKLPSGTSNEAFSAAGVPTQRIRASGASKSRYILYLHGGGFENYAPATYLPFTTVLSRVTNACVLLPNYRLAPEHPFPAALNDCLAVYRWLLKQGVTASQISIIGDSVGGTLTLATALALRDHADPLSAALAVMSPLTDFALTGNSIKAKASVDPVNIINLMRQVIAAYTANGATSVLNPLVSPLDADVHGLPPTLIQIGTQEMLLDDSTRMAAKLSRSGVVVKLEIWSGMWHIFPLSIAYPFGNLLPEASLALQHIANHLGRYMKS